MAAIGSYLLGNSSAANLDITLRAVTTGYSAPVDIVSTGVSDDTRLFIVERTGRIRILYPDGTKVTTPFLVMPAGRVKSGGEQGLLGLAFDPSYSTNRYFYVTYTNSSDALVVARYTRDPANPNLADPNSESIILTVPHPTYTNHNGGDLNFGPDGYLYISTGDGGSGGNPSNSSQNIESLQGKILRINVASGSTYSIPPNNPFVGIAGLDEIWAYGLRNPWRFNFDRQTGDMWIGDVGQSQREEVNFQASGASGGRNYGWRCYEGTRAYNTAGCGPITQYVSPVGEYDHNENRCSVTGGFVYRGAQFPAMRGYYLFGDYCSGHLYTLRSNGSGGGTQELQTQLSANISTFGEDVNGEIYLADLSGEIYQIQTPTAPPTDTEQPTVSITAPANGATVSGSTAINASATDNVGVTRVEFLVDNSVKSTDSSPPYSYSWITTTETNGSHSLTARAYDAADNVASSSAVNVTVNNASSNPLPSPWVGTDVGNVGATGNASHSSGIYTVRGAGSDIGGTSDSFHFVNQQLNGDGQLTARITGFTNTHADAKAGIMIRETLGGNSLHFSVLVKPSDTGGLIFETRSTTGASTTVTQALASRTNPIWLRLQRQNNNLSAYWSSDGISWEHIVNTTLSLPLNNYIGMAVSSHDTSTLATATFDNVSLLSGGASPPVIDLTNPGHTGTYSGVVGVTTDIVDSSGINRVEFYADNVLVSTDTTSPYTYSWDTTGYTNGEHIFAVKAFDNSGNNSTHTHVVDIYNESALERSDVNDDNTVNIFDLSILLTNWNRVTSELSDTRCDVNSSGRVDIFDLSVMLTNWGGQIET